MPDEHDKPKVDPDDTPDPGDVEQERATVTPPFDPLEFAREVQGRPSPNAGMPAAPPRLPPPRLPPPPRASTPRALPRVAPPPMRPQQPTLSDPAELEEARLRSIPTPRHTPPGGALAFANAQSPSIAPPTVPGGASDSVRRIAAAVDEEWTDLEFATRPPPGSPDAEQATRPPPPGMMPDMMGFDEPMPSTRDARAIVLEEPAPPSGGPPTEQEMNDRVSLGDYTGAVDIAERLLVLEPGNAAALACIDASRTVLKQMYTARVGPLDRVPTVAVARDQLRWLSIDHRAGFVLSLIDGVSSVEMILDVSGMPELDALRILSELAQQRIISFR